MSGIFQLVASCERNHMPKTNEEAVSQGFREGLRDLVRNLVGRGLFWVIIVLIGIWAAGIGLSYVSDFVSDNFWWVNPLNWFGGGAEDAVQTAPAPTEAVDESSCGIWGRNVPALLTPCK